MIILGLDIASKTGYAIYDTSRSRSEIYTGVLHLEDTTVWGKAGMGEKITHLCNRIRAKHGADPHLVVIEAKIQTVTQGIGGWGNVTSELHGTITSHLRTMKIPFAVISVKSWRKAIFGEGFKPPVIQKKDKEGNFKFTADGKPDNYPLDWKTLAVAECERLKIELPASIDKGKQDAAEAAMIAIAWYKAEPQGPIGQKAMLDLLQKRNLKASELRPTTQPTLV